MATEHRTTAICPYVQDCCDADKCRRCANSYFRPAYDYFPYWSVINPYISHPVINPYTTCDTVVDETTAGTAGDLEIVDIRIDGCASDLDLVGGDLVLIKFTVDESASQMTATCDVHALSMVYDSNE